MTDTCPIPTLSERRYIAVLDGTERTMLAAIDKALDAAAEQAAKELQTSGFADAPPDRDYFVAAAHQKLFVMLCGGDPDTFEGGDPDTAAHVIDNAQKISASYWKNGGASLSAHPSA